MFEKHYKLVCWLIWIIGFFFLSVPYFFSDISIIISHPVHFLFGTLFSSISFMVLAIYTKKVFENKKLNPYKKNLYFSGITGAFVLTVLYALLEFFIIIESGFSFFWGASFMTMYLGGIVGMSVHAIATKIRNKEKVTLSLFKDKENKNSEMSLKARMKQSGEFKNK